MPEQLLDLVARRDFRGGLNTKIHPTLIDPTQVRKIANGEHNTAGEIATVPGHVALLVSPVAEEAIATVSAVSEKSASLPTSSIIE